MNKIFEFLLSLFKRAEAVIPHNSFPDQNQGVLDDRRDTDYAAGSLPFEVRNASADWRPYVPTQGEVQYDRFTDVQGCVSFSLTNSLETQGKKMDGRTYNWADRFLAKMSGTTKNGNFLYKVADTVRQYGLVNETTYPTPPDFTWDSYYADIPADVVAKGKAEFPFTIAYEWVYSSGSILTDAQKMAALQRHLQHAPIQITIPGQNPIHAVVLVAIAGGKYYYYDSYAPFMKSMDTPPASALKVVLYDNRIILRQVGWNDKEEGLYFAFDSIATKQEVLAAINSTFPKYRLEEKEWNLGKRPWG